MGYFNGLCVVIIQKSFTCLILKGLDMENQYYSEEECLGALQRATDNINQLTNACKEYTRGVNDCFALLANYDLELRGKSKARDYIDFQWNKPREFAVKLKRIKGYTVSDYLIY